MQERRRRAKVRRGEGKKCNGEEKYWRRAGGVDTQRKAERQRRGVEGRREGGEERGEE